ncbi:MAG: tetratricopeptide repeat protein [Beijerinckiaceae bacterium]
MLEKLSSIITGKGGAQDKRRRGDELRDAGKFAEAAEAYGAYLAENPDDFDIWVQRGNCLKDSGAHEAAMMAYERAIQIRPDDADVHLQMGHLMKLRGMVDAAVEAYSRALEINPRLAPAQRELRLLGIEQDFQGGQSNRTPTYIFDLTDVFFYLRHHTTVSGIQRVQLGIAESLLASKDKRDYYRFIAADHDGRDYTEVSIATVSALLRMLKQPTVTLVGLKKLIDSSFNEGVSVDFLAGDTLIVLGAFWVMPTQMNRWIELKEDGVRIGILVHDIIPITNPEYCVADLVDTFTQCFQHVLRMADLILTISAYSQKQIVALLERWKIPQPAMAVLPNAHITWAPSKIGRQTLSPEIEEILAEPFALYVSTIEIRKNHTQVFRVWKKLIETRGAEKVPQLILVGRPGWRVQDLMDQLKGTNYLSGKVRILHDISDVELQSLYQGCLFTTFTSFEEGWGLPVGESLVFGRPCVASNASSIPEVAGDLVDYIDPNNLESAYQVIGRMIDDASYREDRAQKIKKEFKPRSWGQVADDLHNLLSIQLPQVVLDERSKTSKDKYHVYQHTLEPGTIYQFGHENDRSKYIHKGLGGVVNFLFDRSWYPVEDFGRWLKSQRGEIKFQVAGTTKGELVLFLELCTVAWYAGNPLLLIVNGRRHEVTGLEGGKRTIVKVRSSATDGCIHIGIRVSGSLTEGPDSRTDLSIGVRAIGYAAAADIVARQDILEGLTLVSAKSLN